MERGDAIGPLTRSHVMKHGFPFLNTHFSSQKVYFPYFSSLFLLEAAGQGGIGVSFLEKNLHFLAKINCIVYETTKSTV